MDFVCGAQQCLKSKAPGKNEMFPSFCIFLCFRVNFIATAAAAPFTVCFACFRNALVCFSDFSKAYVMKFSKFGAVRGKTESFMKLMNRVSGPWANHSWHLLFDFWDRIPENHNETPTSNTGDLFFTPKKVFERPHWVSTFLSNSRCVHTNIFERYCLQGWILVRNPI